MRVRGAIKRRWVARRITSVHDEYPFAAVVLDPDDRFVAGIASDAGSLRELAELVLTDPRWLGRSVRCLYVERRGAHVEPLRDLARWHDLLALHAERGHAVADWLVVGPRRVRSMCRLGRRA